ncbi:hypothetical protein O6H91_17G040400 [Diphasiastrum complanatum]|uniref:Uncharacterized protein n=1 Tax=Diphasiastrum complanatum TaxID=34168 RepID=A0ACC2B6W8_DIPCM|nr:hypothetical protein O6H91_17G040400 [Diphasiastrum complanatum]
MAFACTPSQQLSSPQPLPAIAIAIARQDVVSSAECSHTTASSSHIKIIAPAFARRPCLFRVSSNMQIFDNNNKRIHLPASGAGWRNLDIRGKAPALAHDASSVVESIEGSDLPQEGGENNTHNNDDEGELSSLEEKGRFENGNEGEMKVEASFGHFKAEEASLSLELNGRFHNEDGDKADFSFSEVEGRLRKHTEGVILVHGQDGGLGNGNESKEADNKFYNHNESEISSLSFVNNNETEVSSLEDQNSYESANEGEIWEDEDLVADSESQLLLFDKAKEDGDCSDEDEEDESVSLREEFDVVTEEIEFSKDGAVRTDVQSGKGADNSSGEKVSVRLTPGDEAKRIKEFCAKVQEGDNYLITTKELASIYNFPLDKFQLLAMKGFLKGSSVVLCAPTSSGKTLVAEVAAAVTLARGRRFFYTTPLKALSNQKWREFRTLFGDSNVGLVTGDAAVNKEAPILIMTTEILRNMLYQSVGNTDEANSLRNVDAVVLDEIHYLSDIARGTTWEETIIYCPKKVQLICLSATIANPEELSGWIAQVHGPTELVVSSRRPVPLLWHFSTRHYILPLLNKKATEINRELLFKRSSSEMEVDMFSNGLEGNIRGKRTLSKRLHAASQAHESGRKKGGSVEIPELSEEQMQFIRRKQVPQIRDTLRQLQARDMLPAIWFIFSRRGCDTAVHYQQEIQLLSDKERKDVRGALRQFRKQHPEAVRESATNFLFRGVAAHHAGCLPLWKSFIEELFQRGLVKVIFATETLAAGINMPARTTVLSALSKKGDNGLKLLSANAMLQMAGRAGRRGIDNQGHVVVVQTPFEGAEECCKLLFAGSDPLVSQFTATYGMALNLLAGSRVINVDDSMSESYVRRRRTLDEARALVEQSFGNYLEREVGVKAKEKVAKLQLDIQKLENENSAADDYVLLEEKIGKEKFREYADLRQLVEEAESVVLKQKHRLEVLEAATMQARLEEIIKEHSSYICISYVDSSTDQECLLPALCLDRFSGTKSILYRNSALANTTSENCSKVWGQEYIVEEKENAENFTQSKPADDTMKSNLHYHHYVALGADNNWYLFTAKSVKSISRNVASEDLGHLELKSSSLILKDKFWLKTQSWRKVGRTGTDAQASVWHSEGSSETLPFSRKLPVLSDLTEDYQVSEEHLAAQKMFVKAKNLLAKRRQKFEETEGYKMYDLLCDLKNMRKQKIARMKAKVSRIEQRIKQMQPSGWKEFLQVLQAAGAIDSESNELLPLGVSALAIRGVNELWLAVALSTENLNALKPAELAAICGTLVGEGTKVRPDAGSSILYEPSNVVTSWIKCIESKRQWLLELQTKNGVEFPCELDSQFSGLVEAWALGVNWKELMMDCGMDEGDVARLLRRSIDLLTQIPFLPRVSSTLAATARIAAEVMDRPPISELVG